MTTVKLSTRLGDLVSPAKPTEVFESYWKFAAERQEVFFARYHGKPWPWTEDPILREYKFTNAYRASDRVSQFLIRNVIYAGNQEPDEVFFRIILFKVFNKIETWRRLEKALGKPLSYATYDFEAYDAVLSEIMSRGTAIFSGAYILPSGRSSFGYRRKHRNQLKLLELMMEDQVPARLTEIPKMQEAFELLLSYPSIGSFLAYQYVIDINYSTMTRFNEMEFVEPGPGAIDGIRKCFADLGGLNEAELIRFVTEKQDRFFERLEIQFRSLWGRTLQLIDCQNLFCEIDKYARKAHPQYEGRSGRTEIKQKYNRSSSPIEFWYPPKWGLNEKIEGDQ